MRLTIADVREMPFEDLIERADAIVSAYDPKPTESPLARVARLGRTLEEMPGIYRSFRTLQSWCDHWTDAMKDQHGQSSNDYKRYRQRRDAMERAASYAKMTYESASRAITVLQGFDETGMPVSRGYQQS